MMSVMLLYQERRSAMAHGGQATRSEVRVGGRSLGNSAHMSLELMSKFHPEKKP